MKSKKTTILLLLVVSIIWGTIIWRIFNYQDVTPAEPKFTFPEKLLTKSLTTKDTIKLSLAYNDPFLKNNVAKSDSIKTEPLPQRLNRIAKWPSIEYNGTVSRHQSGNNRGLLKINKVSYLVCENDIQMEIMVKKVTPDSIGLELNFETQYFMRIGYDKK